MPSPKTKPKLCMTPGCGVMALAKGYRGCCMTCYSTAKKLVDAGKFTWAELESYGMVQSKEDDNPFMTALSTKKNNPLPEGP